MSRLIIRIMFDVKTEIHNYNYNYSFVAGCLPESAGLIWLRPAVRGSMLAMMSKTSGFIIMMIMSTVEIIITM